MGYAIWYAMFLQQTSMCNLRISLRYPLCRATEMSWLGLRWHSVLGLSDLLGFSKLAGWILLALWVADMPFLSVLDWLCSYLVLFPPNNNNISVSLSHIASYSSQPVFDLRAIAVFSKINKGTEKRSLHLCDPVWVHHHFNLYIFRKSSLDCYPRAIIAAGSSEPPLRPLIVTVN